MKSKTLFRVKVALLEAGATQAQMASATALRVERISRIVRRRLQPRARDKRLIAQFLKMSQRELFGARQRRRGGLPGRKSSRRQSHPSLR
jgi:transcriptional regulator with XRE-family HTH domain